MGGDFIFMEHFGESFVLAVIDCTGHGVPGALMTIIASFGLRKIIGGEGWHDPAQILRRLSSLVKTTLHQDTDYARSDDGLDAAICHVKGYRSDREPGFLSYENLTFAGARLPLHYVHDGKLEVLKGDRQSLGYKRSDMNFSFTNHRVDIKEGMCFYMSTDGFVDQPGGEPLRRFGSRQFRHLLKEIADTPFDIQREKLLESLNAHKGDHDMRDDVTMVGFGL